MCHFSEIRKYVPKFYNGNLLDFLEIVANIGLQIINSDI